MKTPKLYFLDTGLCAYLTGWASPATLAAAAMRGAIFEYRANAHQTEIGSDLTMLLGTY